MKDANGFSNRLITCITALLFCTALLLTMTTTVSGRPFRLGKIPDKGKNFKCGTCHANPKPDKQLTTFGSDYYRIGIKAGDTYTKELGELDSDGDGFTNDEEFAAGTHPGDQGSKP